MKNLKTAVVLLVQCIPFLILSSVAWPQQVPPAARPGAVEKSLQPERVKERPGLPEIEIRGEEGRRLEGAEGVTFELKGVLFEGNHVISAEELAPLAEPYVGQTIEVNDLQEIADAVTAYYKKKGYVLSRAYLPPQTIQSDGAWVVIVIQEGRLGKVIVKGNQRYSETVIQNVMRIIRDQGALRMRDLERALLLLMDYPAMTVKATLMAGEESGTTDIVVDVAESKMWGMGVDYNNFGSEFTAEHRGGASASLYNLTGLGDTLRLRGTAGLDSDKGSGLYYGRGEYTIPIGYRGTRLGLAYSYLDYDMGQELAVLDGKGESMYGSLWVSHPLVRSRKVSLWADLGADYRNEKSELLGEEQFDDEFFVGRAGGHVEWVDGLKGRNMVSLNVFQGLDDGELDSRLDADARFTKAEIQIRRFQLLPFGLNALIAGTGQVTTDRLPTSEQIYVGGAGSVRGYAQSEFAGDHGFYGTFELRLPIWDQGINWLNGEAVRGSVQLAGFIDHGKVWVKDAYDSEMDAAKITGAGAGVRVAVSPYANLKVDWAKYIGDEKPLNGSDRDNGVWYVEFSLFY